MKKQLTLKKLSLFVLTALLFVLLSLAFAFTGTARAFADGESQPCPDGQHTLGDIFVVEKQTCVSHGVGVRYCDKCGLSFNVVIPADGISHKVNSEGKCSECGATDVNYVITENLPDKDYVEVGQVAESELKTITIPEKVTTRGETKEVHVADKAFEGNETIESVIIKGTPEIGAEAFKNCKNLTNVTMEDGTQNIAADAFVGTPFYEKKLNEAKNAENKGQLQPISIPISNGNGSYLLKVVDPTTIKTETSGGSAEHEQKPRRNAANETAEAPKTFTYKVASGTKVIAEKAFADLANLVEVTLNPDLLTVGANAFDGCSALKTIYIAKAAENEQPVSDKSFANVAGLAPYNTIYYWGAPQVDENKKDTIFKALANVIRYYSLTEPTDNTHTYWHFVGEGTVQLPTIWNKAVEIALDTSHCTTRFRKGEAFSSEGLVVKVRYDNETQLKEVKNFEINSSAYNATKVTEAGKPYTITVSYLTYLTATYDVTVDDAYTITINYGYEGQATKTELIFVQDGFTLPAAPTREGYKFLGWKVGNAQELMQADEKFTPTADTTVTAQWEKLYKVTATAPNASTTLPTGTYYASGTEVTFSVTPANGYKLVSVKNGNATLTAQDGKYSVTVGKEDIEITVETAAVTVTVTVTATATGGVTPQVSYNDAHDTATITLTTPTKEGYRFDGWTVKVGTAAPAALDGNTYSLKLQHSDVTVTFTAKWTEMLITEAYDATIDANPITLVVYVKTQGFDETTIKNVKLSYKLGDAAAQYLTSSAATKGADYFQLKFDLSKITAGTYELGFVYGSANKNIYGTSTIAGSGTQKNAANTLRYTLKEGDLVVEEPLIVTFEVGHGVENFTRSVFKGGELNLDDITEPTATGYVFLYWYTTATDGTETKQSGTITVTETMTLTAKWAETHTVTIDDWGTTTGTLERVQLDNNITANANKAAVSNNSNQKVWRLYQTYSTALTFATSNDAEIVSVTITFKANQLGVLIYKGTKYDATQSPLTISHYDSDPETGKFTVGNTNEDTTKTNGQIDIVSITVVYTGGKIITDKDRVEAAIENIEETMEVVSKGDIDLLASVGSVELNWTTSDETYKIIGEQGAQKLHIENLPTEADATVILTVTASLNNEKASKTVTVMIRHKAMATGDVVFDFSNLTNTNTGITDTEQALETFKGLMTPSSASGNLSTVDTLTNVYDGSTGGGRGNVTGVLKMGKSKNGGNLKLTFNKAITTVTIVCQNWNEGTTYTISVNGIVQTPSDAAAEMLTFTLTEKIASLEIITSERIYIDSIGVTFYEATNQDRVNDAIKALEGDLFRKTYNTLNDTETLPTESSGVTFENWALKEPSEFAKVENGILTITKIPSESVTLTLTVTVKCGEVSQSAEVTITIEPKKVFTPRTSAPTAGDYLIAMEAKGTWYYLTGGTAGYEYRLAVTTNPAEAATFTVTAEGDGFILKCGEKYLEIVDNSGHVNSLYRDTKTDGCVWKWNAEYNTLTVTVDSDTYFLGSYNEFLENMSASKTSYLSGSNQYPSRLGTYDVETTEPEPEKKEVKFEGSDLFPNNGQPYIQLIVSTTGVSDTALRAAKLVINGQEFGADGSSTFAENGQSILKFIVTEVFNFEAKAYDITLQLDGMTYDHLTAGISPNNNATCNGKNGVLTENGQKLTLTLSAEGTSGDEKKFNGVYNGNFDGQGTLDFFVKFDSFVEADFTDAKLLIGSYEIPLNKITEVQEHSAHLYFVPKDVIMSAVTGNLSLKIGNQTYEMKIIDGGDWTASWKGSELTFQLGGKREGSENATLTVTSNNPAEEFSFNITEVTLDATAEGQLKISVQIDKAAGDKTAKLTINGNDAGTPENVNDGTEFTFTVTPNEAWGNTWELKFTIGGKEGTLPSTVEGEKTIDGKTYTLTKLAEDTLQITVTTKEEEPISGSFTITLSSVPQLIDDMKKTGSNTYKQYSWSTKSDDEQYSLNGLSYTTLQEATKQVDIYSDLLAFTGTKSSGTTKIQRYAYVFNSVATPAPITKISIVCHASGKKESYWQLRTSTEPYTVTAENGAGDPNTTGTVYDEQKTYYNSDSSSEFGTLSWNVTNNDTYFVLYINTNEAKSNGSSYVKSITIEYGGFATGGGTDPTPTPGGGGTEPGGGGTEPGGGSETAETSLTFNLSTNKKVQSGTASTTDLGKMFKTACNEAAEFTGVTKATTIYIGNSNGGPGNIPGCIKFGTGSANGTFEFALSKNVKKISITWVSWGASEGKIKVNKQDCAGYHSSLSSEEWTLSTESSTITIESTKRVIITSITVTFSASSDQGMEGPTMVSYTANMNNGNVESDGLWLALAVGGSALLLVSSLAVVLLLRKHN